MAFTVEVGGGKTAVVQQPSRSDFASNLGGAVSFSLASVIYKVMEMSGGALGAFMAGVGVQFMDRIEPSLVKYTAPLIDMLLKHPELDADIRTFLTQLRNPADAGAAALLAGMGSQVSGGVVGSALNVVLAPLTYALQKAMRTTIPDVTALIAMSRRGALSAATARTYLQTLGYHETFIDGFLELTLKRADIGEWLTGYLRGVVPVEALRAEATAQGVPIETLNLLLAVQQPQLDFGAAMQGLLRGEYDEPELRRLMKQQGWSDENLTTLIHVAHPMPGVGELVRMGVREAYRDDVAAKWNYDADYPPGFEADMSKLGYLPQWSRRFWRAHWELPSVTLGMEMTHRGILSVAEFEELLRIADYPAGWRERMQKVIYSPYTRVDARRMYGLGILDRAGVKRSYLDLGYDDEHAENMTLFTIKYESDDPADKRVKYKELTLGLIQSAYLKNLISIEELRERVLALNYPEDETDLIVEVTESKRAIEKVPDFSAEYRRDVKAIIERAFYKGSLDEGQAASYLAEAGLGDEEINYSLAVNDLARLGAQREAQIKVIGDAYQSGAIDESHTVSLLGQLDLQATEQDRLLSEWQTIVSIGSRRLTEAQYRKALGGKIISLEDYQEAMRGLGYSDKDIVILVAMLSQE